MKHRWSRFLLISLTMQILVPHVLGQNTARIARDLEVGALRVWQSAQAQYQRMGYGMRLSEEDMQIYFLVNAITRSSSLLRELSNTVEGENLRGGIRSLVAMAVELDGLLATTRDFAVLSTEWPRVRQDLQSLAGSANVAYSSGREHTQGRDRTPPPDPMGRLWWQGVVDGQDRILLSGDKVTIEHISAARIRDDRHELSSPLPRRSIPLVLRKIRGRGRVEIIQQPSIRNGYTAIVEIDDDRRGSDTYEFELTWDITEPALRIPDRN